MATYSAGSLSANGARTPGVSNTDFHTRRLFDFSDRVAELAPEESPFFVYLSKVGKVPTSDSQFRFLEDRTKTAITDRSFFIDTGQTLNAAGSDSNITVEAAQNSADNPGTNQPVSGLYGSRVRQLCTGNRQQPVAETVTRPANGAKCPAAAARTRGSRCG